MKLSAFVKTSMVAICLVVLHVIPVHSEEEKGHFFFGAATPFYNTHELLTENMISINKLSLYGLRRFDEKVDALEKPWLSVGYRIGRSIGVDLPISLYTAEVSHEIFGHGFPAKNYDGRIDRIKIDFPPIPYYLDYRSSTKVSGQDVPSDILDQWTHHQTANGIQVENSISHLIKNKFWETNTVDYDSSILLLKTAYAPAWYTLLQSPGGAGVGNENSPHDIVALAAIYSNSTGDTFTAQEIRDKSFLFNSLDPMVLWSWYGVYKYMATGETKTELPSISLFNIDWLPGLSYTITGYGEEYSLNNYFRTEGGRTGSFEYGLGTVDNEYRTSLKVDNLLGGPDSKFELGAELHHWEQEKSGTAGFIDINRYFSDSGNMGVHLKVGYKSFGYLRGHGLKEGAIVSLGFVCRL